MPEKMNASVKAQLVTYLPEALRKVLTKHEKLVRKDMTITNDAGQNINQSATMKATIEQQKAAKAVLVHIEEIIKLARLILRDDTLNATPETSKEELSKIIDEAQARVTQNRLEEEKV
ncbi:MAG: hypothetical protein AAF988_07880 [Pseudomonadota bacterium]